MKNNMNKALCFKFVMLTVFIAIFAVSHLRASELASVLETKLMIPMNSGVTVKWVVPPANFNEPLSKNLINSLQFSVDNQGSPWIGVEERKLINPVKGVVMELSEPFKNFMHNSSGAMMFSTPTTMGFIGLASEIKDLNGDFPVVPYQPLCDLPSFYSKIYKGLNNSVYIVSEEQNKNVVYLLKTQKDGYGKNEGLKGFVKIFEHSKPINSVAGGEGKCFIALDNRIIELNDSGSSAFIQDVYKEKINDLAYANNGGVFFTTDTGVGYHSRNKSFKFLETKKAKISFDGKNLYVLFPENMGIIAIENAIKLSEQIFSLNAKLFD